MTEGVFGAHIPGLEIDLVSFDAAIAMCALSADDKYVELGSGMGRGLIRAVTRTGCSAAGVELMPHAVAHTTARAHKLGCANKVEVTQGDLLRYNTADADVVSIYLGPAFYDLLAPKLERELSPDARVITFGWQVHGWTLVDSHDGAPIQSFLYQPGRRGTVTTPQPAPQPETKIVVATLARQDHGPERGARRWMITNELADTQDD